MAAKFEIQSPKAGEYRWVLVSQGRTLATSPGYASKAAAQNGMASFRKAANNAPLVDLTLPAAKAPAGKAARVAGRALGRAVTTGDRAVKTVEKVAKTTKRAAKTASSAMETAVEAATVPKRGGRTGKRR